MGATSLPCHGKIVIGLHLKHKPNGITKAGRKARKSNDLLKRDFKFDEPLKKCVKDITEIKAKDGKLYVSANFDYFDSGVLSLVMYTNMKSFLGERTPTNAVMAYTGIRGVIIHSDCGTKYMSEIYRKAISKYNIR